MSELTLDDAVAALLSSLTGETVLRDKRGRQLGRFEPMIDPAESHQTYRHPFTQEDLEEAMLTATEKGGSPLSEVWKRIKGEATK